MRQKQRTEFGERLRRAREHAKLSQQQLADAVGVTQTNISHLEKAGAGSPKVGSLARACGVRLLWLERDSGPMLGPEDGSAANVAAAKVVTAPYLVDRPHSGRDYRTLVHTMAHALELAKVELPIKQFVALVDAQFDNASSN